MINVSNKVTFLLLSFGKSIRSLQEEEGNKMRRKQLLEKEEEEKKERASDTVVKFRAGM